jgi:glycosyltransferase involved in cell wall biosynthesis
MESSYAGTAEPPPRPRRRVCSIAYTFYDSDARVMRYCKALAECGDTVDVIALREPGRPKVSDRNGVTVTGVQTRTFHERSGFSYLVRILLFFVRTMFLLSLRQLRRRYDVVHIHSVPDFLVFTAWLPKLMGAKLILDIHDLLPELYASKFGAGRSIFRLLLLVERGSIAFADHLITANDLWHQKLINRSVRPEKATPLLNFPDRSLFRRRGRTREDGKFIVIYPGTLNWHQGLDVAIEAFGRIRTRVPNAEFHIYGVGPALPGLMQQVKELALEDRVRFRGMIPLDEIASAIENADLGVVPKRKDSFGDEAFSTKILEFMALGVPVIVSDTKIDVYYFSERVVKFFRSGDADDLADCMLELITNEQARKALSLGGLQFVQTNFWDLKKSLYFDILDSLTCAPVDGRAVPAAR